MFDLDELSRWDAAMKRIETAPDHLVRRLWHEILQDDERQVSQPRQKEHRAA